MNRKLVITGGILGVAILATFMLWELPILLSAILVFLAYLKHRLYPIKSELLWFTLVFVGGAVIEIFHVNISRGWVYADPQIFNIPLWIPLLWGLTGTNIIVLYEGLIEALGHYKKKLNEKD